MAFYGICLRRSSSSLGKSLTATFENRISSAYSINSSVTLEFFPCPAYFQERIEPDPYRDDADAAGVHLKFCILPYMSCLFSVGFQIWGHSERDALKQIWRQHRGLLQDVLQKSKPMIYYGRPLIGGRPCFQPGRVTGQLLRFERSGELHRAPIPLCSVR